MERGEKHEEKNLFKALTWRLEKFPREDFKNRWEGKEYTPLVRSYRKFFLGHPEVYTLSLVCKCVTFQQPNSCIQAEEK